MTDPEVQFRVSTEFTPDKSKFKNSSGTHLLKPIFFELDEVSRPYAQYTLKSYDHSVSGVIYPSLRRLFVELEDPTEYLFATTYLDGWDHWKKLSSASFFQEFVSEWREELEVRIRAKALSRVKSRAASNSKDSLAADKILLSGGWKSSEGKQNVGRPSKEKIRQEAEKMFQDKSEFLEDLDRLNLQ